MAADKHDSVSLDALNPLDLEGTPEDIALVERGLAIMARKQVVWASVVEGWKKLKGSTAPVAVPPVVPQRDHNDKGGAVEGTLASLIGRYRTDERSGYHKIRFKTREHYDGQLDRIIVECGGWKLADLKGQHIQQFYDGWAKRGNAIARSLVTMLRMLFGFGATILGDTECERLSVVMHKMRFKMNKPRNERLTFEQANAIRAMAHKMGRPSIALAQAFQFEVMLRQRDVIGEWVPASEPGGLTGVTAGNEKWLRGIRWSEIDRDLILRHTPSNGGKDIEVDLNLAPMVMDELALYLAEHKLTELPTAGPVIVCEFNDLPWTAYEFRRWWRKLATACGIPKSVFNMDSRADGKRGADARSVSNGKSTESRYRSAEHEGETEKERPTESKLFSVGHIH